MPYFYASGKRRWQKPGEWWDPETKDHPKDVIQNTHGMSLSMSILSWLMPNYTNGILNNNILMPLFRGLSSELIIPPCVRASVPPPRGSSKHMLLHHTV